MAITVCSLSNNMGDYKGTYGSRCPDTANAGCTFSDNMEPCASAAKPESGRHAVRQAKISRAKEEGRRRGGLSAEQKEGKPTVV